MGAVRAVAEPMISPTVGVAGCRIPHNIGHRIQCDLVDQFERKEHNAHKSIL